MTDEIEKPDGQESKPDDTKETNTEVVPKTFSEDYVKELRAENAKWRVELRELQASEAKRTEDEKESETKRLEKQEEWQKLAEARQVELDNAKAAIETQNEQIKQSTIRNAIITEAAKQNSASPEDVYQLIDKSQITIDENGNVTGYEETVKALLEAKPYLVSTKSPNGVPRTPKPQGKSELTDTERRVRAARTF